MATVNVTLPVDVAPIAAPLLFSTLIHWYLYGALAVQVYLYYHAFPADGWRTQGLVYSLFAAGSAQAALATRAVFCAYAAHFGDTSVLEGQTEWLAGPVLGGVVTCAVQVYYARHIWVHLRVRVLQIIIVTLALTQGAAALVAGAQRARGADDAISTGVWLVACALCDAVVACAMVYLLLRPTPLAPPPPALAARAVRLGVASGVLTAAASITLTILHFTTHPNPLQGTPAAHAALSSTALLALLNGRARLVPGGARSYDVSTEGAAFTSGFGFEAGVLASMQFEPGAPCESGWSGCGEVKRGEGGM